MVKEKTHALMVDFKCVTVAKEVVNLTFIMASVMFPFEIVI